MEDPLNLSVLVDCPPGAIDEILRINLCQKLSEKKLSENSTIFHQFYTTVTSRPFQVIGRVTFCNRTVFSLIIGAVKQNKTMNDTDLECENTLEKDVLLKSPLGVVSNIKDLFLEMKFMFDRFVL